MALTTFACNEIIDHLHGTGSWTAPASVDLALFTAAPTDAYTTGAPDGTEVSGSGYARAAITFGAASARAAGTSSAESFTPSGGNYGTVTHIGIFQVSTNNLLWWAPLTNSRVVNDGDTLEFASGAVDFAFSAS